MKHWAVYHTAALCSSPRSYVVDAIALCILCCCRYVTPSESWWFHLSSHPFTAKDRRTCADFHVTVDRQVPCRLSLVSWRQCRQLLWVFTETVDTDRQNPALVSYDPSCYHCVVAVIYRAIFRHHSTHSHLLQPLRLPLVAYRRLPLLNPCLH